MQAEDFVLALEVVDVRDGDVGEVDRDGRLILGSHGFNRAVFEEKAQLLLELVDVLGRQGEQERLATGGEVQDKGGFLIGHDFTSPARDHLGKRVR
jgi:hypothetical protein